MGEFSLSHLIILGVILFCSVVFPLIAIVHAAKSTNKNKILWIVIIFVANFFGALLYWFIGRTSKPDKIS